MRRDTQIGIILGIVILVIIGVFLSTRTSDNKAVLPDLVLSEGGGQEAETEKIDIEGFFKESKEAEPKEAPAVEYSTNEPVASEEPVQQTEPVAEPVSTPEIVHSETTQDDSSLEGKWEGVAEEIAVETEVTEQSVTIDETEAVQETASTVKVIMPEEKAQTPSYAPPPGNDIHYKVQSNDTLYKIASKHYGDGNKWQKIFEANRESLPDPNALYVGQELLIPDVTGHKEMNEAVVSNVSGELEKRDFSNVDTHTVEPGDTLYRIAEKYYDDPGEWMKIYEANADQIEDKGLLMEGQILIIPNL